MADRFELGRFVDAQADAYSTALAEIAAGNKRTHWMWFVFPQIAGLGRSATARHYAIASIEEARAYLDHPLLGPRLIECVAALVRLADPDAEGVFGPVDAVKLRSSLTLFARAGAPAIVEGELQRWFGGPDPATLRLLTPL